MNRKFLDDNFLLYSDSAKYLYHTYAASLPIIDYHNHLSPLEISENKIFENISQIWLAGDHYKWRAMRTMGVDEHFITGKASDLDKFRKWAEVLPYTLGNPLFHWSQMELKTYFGVDELLNTSNCDRIYQECTEKLNSPQYSYRELLLKMNVEVVCTTDDPADDLHNHEKIKEEGFPIKVLPTFRADACLFTDNPVAFNAYVNKLSDASKTEINNISQLLEALKLRHDFFHAAGCRLSDNGLEELVCEPYTEKEVDSIFTKLRRGKTISAEDKRKYQSMVLQHVARLNHNKKWVQQFHLGALRNVNERMFHELGKDAGFDSIGDFNHGRSLGIFLSTMDADDELAKTILYNLNPRDNELFATMAGNFNTGGMKGKIQYGAAWWYLDQKDGIENQLKVLSNMGILSCFVGMLTDSRSILSFPRHEYFRRVLCNLLGEGVEKGELPDDGKHIGTIVQDICYNNAKEYFGF